MIIDIQLVVSCGTFEVIATDQNGWTEYRTGQCPTLQDALVLASNGLGEELVIPLRVRRQHHEPRFDPPVIKWVRQK